MPNFQQVIVMGHLGRDPEVRYTASGDAVANISIAVSEKRKDKEHTEWFRISAFGKTAELIAEYTRKGTALMVIGRLQTRKWTDKAGAERYTTEVIADRIQFLGKGDGRNEQSTQPQKADSGSIEDIPDDLPF